MTTLSLREQNCIDHLAKKKSAWIEKKTAEKLQQLGHLKIIPDRIKKKGMLDTEYVECTKP